MAAGVSHIVFGGSWTVIAAERIPDISGRFVGAEKLLTDLAAEGKVKWTSIRGGWYAANTVRCVFAAASPAWQPWLRRLVRVKALPLVCNCRPSVSNQCSVNSITRTFAFGIPFPRALFRIGLLACFRDVSSRSASGG